MLTTDAKNMIAKFIDDTVVSADYTVNGVTYPAKFRRSIVSVNSVTKHVYLTTKDPIGIVTRVRLLTANGTVFDQNTISKVHEKNKGRLFTFEYKVEEVIG